MAELISAQLRRRVRSAGAGPLITYYDLDSAERTELSAVSLGNWVAKTANLIVDELMLERGDRVALPLADRHPGHWVTAIWELACWQAGVAVVLDGSAATAVRCVHPGCGPEVTAEGHLGARRREVVCSLNPLGLPLADPPPGALDYNLEVRAHPDQFLGADPAPEDLAWDDGTRRLAQAGLVAAVAAEPRRRLVRPAGSWDAVADLLAAIGSTGSLVVVAGSADADRLSRIAEEERVAGSAWTAD